ncbi:MAG: UTP--glucose-1-phosphate uridylyltransferase GalU [Betaproteobacteria bacterium]|nr:UTP--glucose-1-phosphate uridylyltransferase GalU [Betaproteobacteria bacterium]MSQ87948.1 UTP--glucose-1-phosphate uridylyltransferase GalU [Betaproteobacteria bacterium]
MQRKITKAVFPVAGLGRRFLPLTKASPKEMLPLVDKPLIQYAVEEAAAAGITEMIFITGRTKRAIEDHFDRDLELERELAEQGKRELLEAVKTILPKACHCVYIRQPEALGLGHAVLCAQPIVRDQPFAVLLADDLIDANPPMMARMTARFETEGCSLLGIEEVQREQTGSYGIVSPADARAEVTQVQAIIEKPAPKDAPSTFAAVGRYVLTPAIFEFLAAAKPGKGGEIQLTDAIAALLAHERVLAMRIGGKRYDCGSKLGYLKATVALGLRHPEIGKDFAEFLAQRER